MKANKFILLLGVFFVLGLFIASSTAQAFSFPIFRPVIVTFGDSNEVQATVNTLMADYPQAVVVKYQDTLSLFGVLTLMRSYSPLILVGHGSAQGILGPSNNIISWKNIGTWINTLPSTYVFFLACDSYNAGQYINVKSTTYPGPVDGILGAITVAAALQHAYGNTNAIQQLSTQFMSRIILLQTNKAKLVPLLIVCDSPTVLSLNTISPACGGSSPPPTYTVTFTEAGLPSGQQWSVEFNGIVYQSTTNQISFSGQNSGTYSYSISNVLITDVIANDIYYVGTSSGTVAVNGANVNVAVSFAGPYVYGYHYLGPQELVWDTETLLTDIFIGLLPATGLVDGLSGVIRDGVVTGGLKIVIPVGLNIIDGLIFGLSWTQIVWNIIASISALFTFVINAINTHNWSWTDGLIIFTITVATFIFWQSTGDAALAVQLVIVLGLEAIDINRLMTDYYDTNTTPDY